MTQSIKVKHNVEMAHRLFETKGKCEAIHGHSWWVELEIFGDLAKNGMVGGLDFGYVKKQFRTFLDDNFDHHVLLNRSDPWSKPLASFGGNLIEDRELPGLQTMLHDPTTENFAALIGEWAMSAFNTQWLKFRVTVWETSVNAATWESK